MSESKSAPNILLITTDQQRTDTLGAYGSRHVRTPNLDRMAAESVVFDRAYVQNTVCVPSRACIQTGRYTHQHGVRYMESVIDRTPGLPAHEQTFMGHLRKHGYTTGAAGKIHMMPERDFDYLETVGGKGSRWTRAEGMDIGPAPLGKRYAAWLNAKRPGAYEEIYRQRRRPEYRRNKASIVNCLPLEEYVETYILEKSLEFMQADHAGRPWFLWCGFCGPHGPHDPPASHAGLYPPEDVALPPTLGQTLLGRPPHLRPARPPLRDPGDEAAWRVFIAYYYALCTLIDDYVGRLLEAMRRTGLLENTLIVYTSDHGEMLGDFGLVGKGNFYEPVVRVPLIARPPGGCAGRRMSGLTEVMDIAPTVLDFAGLPAPHEMQASSFRRVLEGETSGGHDAVLCEYTSNDLAINGKCLVTPRYKYILWDTEHGGELYDLQEDPHECRNLYYEPAFRTVRDQHAEMLLKHLMRSETGYNGSRTAPY